MRRGLRWVIVLGAFAMAFLLLAVVATWSSGPRTQIPSRAVVWMKLSGAVSEEDRRSSFERALLRKSMTLRDYVRVLDTAAADRKVRGLVLQPEGFGGGWAMAQELRDAILRFRASGKPVVAYLEVGENKDYYLASACGRVVMMPAGVLFTNGILADAMFLKGTLEKLGVEPDLEHIGAYKSASEMFTREGMSEAQREATNYLLDGLFERFVGDIAEARKLEPAAVLQAIDEGFYSARRARELHLVDELRYEDEVLDSLAEEAGGPVEKVRASAYASWAPESSGGPRIGLIYLTGTIVSGASSSEGLAGNLAGSATLAEAIRDLREDASIRAVVLRVDSPGGSGMASDVIWRELGMTRKVKPVIVSMGDVAASGGYYVAMGADAIVAQPSTITGSIGVILGKFSFRGMYDWAGVHKEQIKRGENADLFSDYQKFTDAQRGIIRGQMREFYDDFVQKAADGRKTTVEAIDRVGQGRVWTGGQALERKLVDELGGLDRAIAIAKERAGIDAERSVVIEVYPKPKGFFESLGSQGDDAATFAFIAKHWIPAPLRGTFARWTILERLASEPYLYLEARFL